MVETPHSLIPQAPLADVVPGTYGAPAPTPTPTTDSDSGEPPVTLAPERDAALVSVMPRRGRAAALGAALESSFGLTLPAAGRSVSNERLHLLWAGLDKWYVQAPGTTGPDLMAHLDSALGAEGPALTDQSHGQALIRVAGPGARDLLAKAVPIDLHPDVFALGHVAATLANHTSILLWHRAPEVYQVMVMRGFARDLWDFLTAMGTENGYAVAAA